MTAAKLVPSPTLSSAALQTRGRVMPDGQRITAGTEVVRPGWRLQVPADANLTGNTIEGASTHHRVAGETVVVVEPGEHLWG